MPQPRSPRALSTAPASSLVRSALAGSTALALLVASSTAMAQQPAGSPPAATSPGAPATPPAAATGPAGTSAAPSAAPPSAPPPSAPPPPPSSTQAWGSPAGAPPPAPGGYAAPAGYGRGPASGYDLSSRYPDYPPGYAPRRIPSDGGAPPPGYQLDSEPRSGLWITGAALAGGVYLATFLVAGTAVSEGEEDLAPLFIPVVGPWVAVRTSDDGDDELRVPLVMSGIAQLAGVGLLIGGLAAQREVFVRSDAVRAEAPKPTATFAVGPGNVSMLGQF